MSSKRNPSVIIVRGMPGSLLLHPRIASPNRFLDYKIRLVFNRKITP